MAAHPFLNLAHEGDLDGLKESLGLGGVDINTHEKGVTALHLAASRGHLEVVRYLCAAGASVNSASEPTGAKDGLEGATPLGLAALMGYTGVVSVLLDEKADPNMAMARGVTALTAATCSGHLEVVKTLVSRGADVNQVEDDGWSALMLACLNGQEEIGRYLSRNGADKDVVAKDGTSLANAVVAIRNTSTGA